jgi:hypothetical protein
MQHAFSKPDLHFGFGIAALTLGGLRFREPNSNFRTPDREKFPCSWQAWLDRRH